MKVKIISWNVRGLNEEAKRSSGRSLMGKWKAYIICLHEAKIVDWSSQIVQQMWGNRWAGWTELKASGSGWDNNTLG